MCAAPRKPANRGLERNLTTHSRGGYRWTNPQTRKVHYFGKQITRTEANEAARTLNLHFAKPSAIVDKVAAMASPKMRHLIERHRQTLGKKLAESTTSGRKWELQKIEREIGHAKVSEIRTVHLREYLDSLDSDNLRVRYRARLCELFDTAMAVGMRDDNPARPLRTPKGEVLRERLSQESYEAIYGMAEDWLQKAMDLGLQTLQRREDLVLLEWSDIWDGALHVAQGKSGGNRRLAIKIGPELQAVLNRCRDGIDSPFILHRLPEKARPHGMRAKKRQHHTQIMPEQVTRAFGKAFERSGVKVSAGKTRPTFHEIRSLGISEYRHMGWTEEQVQDLAGHEDAKMTRHYMDGHEPPWEHVGSGLKLGGKRY